LSFFSPRATIIGIVGQRPLKLQRFSNQARASVEAEPTTPFADLKSSASAVMALESVKERFEKITGWARPSARDLDAALRPRKANAFRFKDDGVIPNNPKLPLVLYRSPIRLSG
jgi:hypothetical protein